MKGAPEGAGADKSTGPFRGEGRKWTDDDNCSDASNLPQCFQFLAILAAIIHF